MIASFCSGFAITFGILLSGWLATLWRREWEAALSQAIIGPFLLGWVGIVASFVVGAYSLVLTLPAIIFAEVARIRTLHFYALAGAVAGPSAYYLFAYRNDAGPFAPAYLPHEWTVETVLSHAGFWLILVLAGVLGGLVYWRMAGERAGEWRSPSTTD